MGMTIDETIYCMQSYLPSEEYTHCTECKYYGCNTNRTCKSNEAHQKAIEIMHKYQTMQEVLERVWNVPSCMLDEAECLNKIMETYRIVR